MAQEIWTIGHSDRAFGELVALLRGAEIGCIADVRRFTGSRRNPQFGRDRFEPALAAVGIGYYAFEALGGRRGRARPGSANAGWRVEAFNAYADHMDSPEFRQALADLIELANHQRVAIMCAEAVPWRCHRRLIADALVVRGWTVHDILGPARVADHRLSDFARVETGRITYPAEANHGGASPGNRAAR